MKGTNVLVSSLPSSPPSIALLLSSPVSDFSLAPALVLAYWSSPIHTRRNEARHRSVVKSTHWTGASCAHLTPCLDRPGTSDLIYYSNSGNIYPRGDGFTIIKGNLVSFS